MGVPDKGELTTCVCGNLKLFRLMVLNRRWCLECGNEYEQIKHRSVPIWGRVPDCSPASIESFYQSVRMSSRKCGVILTREAFLRAPISTALTPEMVIALIRAGFPLAGMQTMERVPPDAMLARRSS